MPDKVAMFLWAVDVRDRHDLGILLEDVSMESGLTKEWNDVRSNVSRFMKRKQWIGNEEKKTPESKLVPRAGMEDQSCSSQTTIEKTVSLTTMEQLLKGIKDLKIAVMKTVERPTGPRYRGQRYSIPWRSIKTSWCRKKSSIR